MKKIIHNNRILVIAFLTLFGTQAFAGAGGGNTVPAELTLQSVINNQPLVQLQLDAPDQQDDFTIVISDTYGTILYRENIRAARFTKQFLFNTEEIGNEILRFEIISNKTRQSKVYSIDAAAATLSTLHAVQAK